MNSDVAAVIAVIGLWVGLVCLAIGLFVLKIWIVGSLLTSTVKVASGDCGKHYPIEHVMSGNWFCPSK